MIKAFIFSLLLLSFNANAEGINLNGTWTGQVQFQATLGGEVVQTAHSVNTFMLVIHPHGKVVGISKENGCKLLGVASPSMGSHLLNLDITVSECSYNDYNQRYKGRIAFYEKRGDADFSLQWIKMIPGKQPKTADIKATLFRQ